MSELTAKRWDKGDGLPQSHKPIEAVEVALHRLRSGDWPADHVFVICASIGADGMSEVNFTQAGDFNAFAQEGMLDHAKRLIWQDIQE